VEFADVDAEVAAGVPGPHGAGHASVRLRTDARARHAMSAARAEATARTERAALIGFVAFIAASAGLSAIIASGPPILAARWGLLWRLAGWAVVWSAGVVLAWRLPRHAALPLILVAGALIRLAALAGPPVTSDDLYRYSWDGRVQAASGDPYRYPPIAPQLVGLREGWLWPDPAGCASIHRPPGCTRINRPGQRTIYPPLAEAWFVVVYRVASMGARHKAWQAAALVIDLAVVWLLTVALRRWGCDERWVAVYALCPAPALELVNNGHVDGVAIALLLAGLAVARPPPRPVPLLRSAARDLGVGVLVGAAALVKVYPALMLVALVGTPGAKWRVRVARSAAAASALVVVAYLPHVVAAGGKVVGYLPGYLKEEHYTKGGRFLLAGALGLHGTVATATVIVAFVSIAVWVGCRRPRPAVGAVTLFGALLLLSSPVQPWYAVAVIAVAAFAGRPWWAAVAVAGYPYFFAVILASRHAVGIGEAAYGLAALVVAGGETWAARRAHDPAGHASLALAGHP
jgi:hypothetical protein